MGRFPNLLAAVTLASIVRATFALQVPTPPPAFSPAAPTPDASVAQIFSGGRWCRGAKQGRYRVLLHTRGAGLAVQLARSGEAASPAGTTISVNELSGPDLVVAAVQVESPPDDACGNLTIRGRIVRSSRGCVGQERFELLVNQFGGYEIAFSPD